jgi:hypothetical protein
LGISDKRRAEFDSIGHLLRFDLPALLPADRAGVTKAASEASIGVRP